MEAYYSDGRGRYSTGESYDWFYKYEDGIEPFTSSDGLWTYTLLEEGVEILRYNGNDISIIVPDTIEGKKVVSLDSTFDGFYELKRAVIPEGITAITGAFFGCENLEQVVLPETLVDMTYAFNCCYSLENIDIPKGVRQFSSAFVGTRLEHIVFPKGAEDISDVCANSECLKSVFIPKSVKNLNEAFCDCETLSKVTIEDGITSISDWAFYHCMSLLELMIPESVTQFGNNSVGYMELREYTNPQRTGFKIKGTQIVPGFKIKGILGSAAEKYAKKHGIEFEGI